jgi:hypothetical protein
MILISQWSNAECLKCHDVNKNMVKVGAFQMCVQCYVAEFKNPDPIDPNSERGKKYYEWLKAYKDAIEFEGA